MTKQFYLMILTFVGTIVLLVATAGCGGTREVSWKDTSAAVEIRIYAIPLQSNVDAPVTIDNIRRIASHQRIVKDRTPEEVDTNQEYYDPMYDGPRDIVGRFAGRLHGLRMVGTATEEYELRGLCEIIYVDSTREEFLIDRNGYIRFGDVVLQDSFRVLNLLGIVCQ